MQTVQQIVSGSDKTWLPWAQLVSHFFGFTVSKGAPGGEAVGELYAARGQQADRVKEALPAFRDLFQQGKREEAVSRLRGLGLPPEQVRALVRIYSNPGSRLSPRQLRDFKSVRHTGAEGPYAAGPPALPALRQSATAGVPGYARAGAVNGY
jgi:hypothetical protein